MNTYNHTPQPDQRLFLLAVGLMIIAVWLIVKFASEIELLITKI